jgi:hypothetical protein
VAGHLRATGHRRRHGMPGSPTPSSKLVTIAHGTVARWEGRSESGSALVQTLHGDMSRIGNRRRPLLPITHRLERQESAGLSVTRSR